MPNNAVDLDQLERDVRAAVRPSQPLPDEITQYAPKRPSERMPLEIIAQAITRLTWADAEAMGKAIQDKAKANSDNDNLTSAIQAWAKDYGMS